MCYSFIQEREDTIISTTYPYVVRGENFAIIAANAVKGLKKSAGRTNQKGICIFNGGFTKPFAIRHC
jgi:hypothetical protein